MPGSPCQPPALARAQADIHLFERPEETGEGLFEVRGPLPGLAEVFGPELIAAGYDGGAKRPVFMGALSPGKVRIAIDPKGKSHVFSKAHCGTVMM